MVTPNFRVQVDCECGCGAFGTARASAWASDGKVHTRNCVCSVCSAAKHRPQATRREKKLAKAIGGNRDNRSGGLSGFDVRNLVVEVEETTDQAIVGTIRRWWDSKRVKAKRARLWARTFSDAEKALVLQWDDEEGRGGLVVMELDAFTRLAARGNAEVLRESE